MPETNNLIDTWPARLTAKEASQYLRLHQNTIYKWVRAGLIPAIRQGHKGRQIRFRLTDLMQWEAEQTTGKL